MATNQNRPWFSQQPDAGMNARIERIHKLRDPGTFADEILRYSKRFLWLTLIFTGVMCFFSYVLFLERFLPWEAAFLASIVITVLVEFGKNKLGIMAVRMPLMQGWRYIFATPWNTGVWIGTTLFGLLIFAISIYNSTNGAAKYAETSAQERTEKAFTTSTQDIDQQIASTQERINKAPKVKWKKKYYYQDPESVRAAEQSLAILQEQKKEAVTQQRADFERGRNIDDKNNSHSASIALAIGGWLEALQIILIFVCAFCERVLDGRMNTSTQSPTQRDEKQNIGYKQFSTANAENQNPPINSRTQIGFKRPHPPTEPPPVTQLSQPVTQGNGLLCGQQADDAIRHYLNALKREPSNFNNPHAKTETVADRMHKALQAIVSTLHGVGWCSNTLYKEAHEYIHNTALPVLQQKGFPYDSSELDTLLFNRAREGNKA
jgi:hypothetical protein